MVNRKLLTITCLTAVITTLLVYGRVYFDLGRQVPARADFRAFLTAADMSKSGASGNLYSIPQQILWQSKRFGHLFPIDNQNLLVFAYPPWIATCLTMLGGKPVLLSYSLMLLFNFLILVGCVAIILSIIPNNIGGKKYLICLFLAYPPVVWTLINGQFSLLLLLGILGGWYGIQKNLQFSAGLLLGILLIKPYLLILPFLYICFTRKWRTLMGLFTAGLICLLLSLPVGGWDAVKAWAGILKLISNTQHHYGIHPEGMHSIKGVLYSLKETLPDSTLTVLWVVLDGLIGIICINTLWQASHHNQRNETIIWGLICSGTLLAAPHANSHDLTLLIPCYMVFCLIKITYYKNLTILTVVISFIAVWGSVLYETNERPVNRITVPAILALFLILLIQYKIYDITPRSKEKKNQQLDGQEINI